MTDDLKERVKSLGETLTAFAKLGPQPTRGRTDMQQLVEAFVAEYATPLDAAVEAYRVHCEKMHQSIVDAGGLPVRSVVSASTEPGESAAAVTTALPGMNSFELVLPHLQSLLRECVHDFRVDGAAYFEREREAFRVQLDTYLQFVPKGGTKAAVGRSHVMPIKSAASDLLRWEKQAIRIQWLTYFQQARLMFEMTPQVLAMQWHFAASRCLVAAHESRDGDLYAVRGSWAWDKGFIQATSSGCVDSLTYPPGREFGCQCELRKFHSLSALPKEMLTAAGEAALEHAAFVRKTLLGDEPLTVQLKIRDASPPPPAPAVDTYARPGFWSRLFARRS